jgi:hypothetical protein
MTLEFIKLGTSYNSKHGGQWFHIYFKGKNKSYRTALFMRMRNFNNWKTIIEDAERGDTVGNLRTKLYMGKPIIDADSKPTLYKQSDVQNIMDNARFNDGL